MSDVNAIPKRKQKILVMDDQPEYLGFVFDALLAEGFDLDVVTSEQAALDYLMNNHVDVAILDVDLMTVEHPNYKLHLELKSKGQDLHVPEIGAGFRVSTWIRKRFPFTGILIFTSQRRHTNDVIEGFDSGVDAYVLNELKESPDNQTHDAVKALGQEIVSRARKINEERKPVTLIGTLVGNLYFNLHTNVVTTVDHISTTLSQSEMNLIQALCVAEGNVSTRGALYFAAFRKVGTGNFEKAIDDLISQLRKKFRKQLDQEVPIKTVYGQGYLLTQKATFDFKPFPHLKRLI